jgi:hypothetical protein
MYLNRLVQQKQQQQEARHSDHIVSLCHRVTWNVTPATCCWRAGSTALPPRWVGPACPAVCAVQQQPPRVACQTPVALWRSTALTCCLAGGAYSP